jgi:HD domain
LTAKERRALVRTAAQVQLATVPKAVRRAVGVGRGRRSALVEGRTPPDSRLTRWAHDLAAEASAPPLLAHCVRCWYWGDLFAQLDGVRFDPELLYLACLLHDLGLTDRYRAVPGDHVHCFAVHGAEVARDELAAVGVPQARRDVVAAAIARHMDVRSDRRAGAEAYLLHEAAHLDVAGTRARDLSRPVRQAVVAREPRHGFAAAFGQQMAREALERPGSRAAVLWRLGARRALMHNPLDREAG